jgi:hypothetical protein
MVGVPRHPRPPQITNYTDASVVGWGAHIWESLISNVWTMEEQELHINVLELEVVRLALFHSQKEISRKSVLIATNNMRVVAYTNRQGGPGPPTCASWLSRCCSGPRQISLTARHILGKLNVIADLLTQEHQVIHTETLHHVHVQSPMSALEKTYS